MVSPLLVSFGTGLLKRYNERKKAKSAADYEMALNQQEKIWEMEKLVEDRNHEYNIKIENKQTATDVEFESTVVSYNERVKATRN